MGDGCLNNEHFEELGGILKEKLEEHFKNQELRQGRLTQILLMWDVVVLWSRISNYFWMQKKNAYISLICVFM